MISAVVAVGFAGLIVAMTIGLVRLQRQLGACDDGSCSTPPSEHGKD